MLRKISICVLLIVVVVIGVLLTRRVPDQGPAPVAEIVPDSSATHLRKFPPSSRTSDSTPLQPAAPVTLEDISSLSDPAQLNGVYENITSELIGELTKLRSTRDGDRVASRITPIAQKFYYLKKAHQSLDDAPPFNLPRSFRPDIQELEELWDSNSILAQSTDSVFAHMDLLDGEHVPYQLREHVLTQ
ncbi:hypothetical protein [Haloferula sp.]|uniref:hypothetical protein n=1 Tax=Haloferula sp. TaxID=2497595 RepID=UPI0032A0B4E4